MAVEARKTKRRRTMDRKRPNDTTSNSVGNDNDDAGHMSDDGASGNDSSRLGVVKATLRSSGSYVVVTKRQCRPTRQTTEPPLP